MQIRDCGEQAVILSVSYDKTADAASAVREIYTFICENPHPSIVSVRPGLDCLLVEYSGDIQEWLGSVQSFVGGQGRPPSGVEQTGPKREKRMSVEVPVCYDFGQDIPMISAATGLKPEEIIDIHSSTTYKVWMLGFMPGFPYLGELPHQLQIRRKDTPATMIPGGSVAIAEEFVGIYPFQSPGGWHVIGRTPLNILDYRRPIPWTFDHGMEVKFVPISADEYQRMKQ